MRNFCVVFMCFFILQGCKKQGPPPGPPADTSIPTLTWALTSFASTTKFYPFGETLPNSTVNKGYEIQIASPSQTQVLSVCKGIVTAIVPGPNGNTIHVLYKPHSVYSFIYSGVDNVQIHVNDTINQGITIGRVNNAGIIDFSLVLNNNTALCPQAYGAPAFNNNIQVAINQHNAVNPADSISSPCEVGSVPE